MATVYTRDDSGAPVYGFGIGGLEGWLAFKAILRGCLVTGYAGRPSAGWELVAEADRHIVFRVGSGAGYVGFFHANAGDMSCTVWLSQTYSGVSNNQLIGAGARSGLAANSAVPQRFHLYFLAHSSENSSWYLVADARSFVFVGAGFGNASPIAQFEYDFRALYVGETSEGYLVAVGGENLVSGSPTANFNGLGCTFLTNPATGLLVDTGALSVEAPALRQSSSLEPVVTLDHLDTGGARIYGAGADAGCLRGVVVSPEIAGMHTYRAGLNLGLSISVSARTFATQLPLGDGWAWFLGLKNPLTTACYLVTNRPEFW